MSANPDNEKIARVWPAFGKTGGSHELLITKPDRIQNFTTRSLRKGISGSWHQEFDSDLKDIAYREFKEFIDRFDYEKK